MWLAASGGRAWGASVVLEKDPTNPLAPALPHFAAKAKRVIYPHMAGAPSQHELFDYKPELPKLNGKECPKEFLEGKQFAFIQGVPKMLGPQYAFQQHGQSGAWVSDRLAHFSSVVDDVCFIKSIPPFARNGMRLQSACRLTKSLACHCGPTILIIIYRTS